MTKYLHSVGHALFAGIQFIAVMFLFTSCSLFNHGGSLKYVPYNKVLTFDLNRNSDYLISPDSNRIDIIFLQDDTVFLNTVNLQKDTFYIRNYELSPGAVDYSLYHDIHRGSIYTDNFLQHDSLSFTFANSEVKASLSRLARAEGYPTYVALSGVYLDSGTDHRQVAVLYQDTTKNRQPVLYAHDTVIAANQPVEGPDILCIYLKKRKRWQLHQTIMLDSVNSDYGEVNRLAAVHFRFSDYGLIYISSMPDTNSMGIEENIMMLLPGLIKSDRKVRTYRLD